MKTLNYVKKYYVSHCMDGRDINRLAQFVPNEDLEAFGFKVTDEDRTHLEWTRENILGYLESDLAFGFEKALDKRGLSASFMVDVVMMWNWILQEGLEDFDQENNYAQYGLPIFKATALKYGFPNPIGDKAGTEFEFSSEGEYSHV